MLASCDHDTVEFPWWRRRTRIFRTTPPGSRSWRLRPPRPLEADARQTLWSSARASLASRRPSSTLRSIGLQGFCWSSATASRRGASGRNAGQGGPPTSSGRCRDIADAVRGRAGNRGQRDVRGRADLLDRMVAEAGAKVRVERFTGRMGMFNLHQSLVHLRCNRLRPQPAACRIEGVRRLGSSAAFLDEIRRSSRELSPSFRRRACRSCSRSRTTGYRAVLSEPKGCANGGLLCEQVLATCERAVPRPVRGTPTTRMPRWSASSMRIAPSVTPTATGSARRRVVLCTNGLRRPCRRGRCRRADPARTRAAGSPARVGIMAAFAGTAAARRRR